MGNPLLDEIKEFRNTKIYKNVAFLPGSRISEINSLMPIFRKVASKIKVNKLLVVPYIYKDRILEIYEDVSDFEVVYDAKKALLRSDASSLDASSSSMMDSILSSLSK